MKLNGKTAFVTGSSRGIGQQIALGLAKEGCNIIVHGRTEENCKNTFKILQNYSIKVFSVYGELSERTSILNIIEQVNNLNCNVDILYNNAAIMSAYRDNYLQQNWEDWIQSYKINVIAVYELCAAFIPRMIDNGFGRIVNLTSRINSQPELAPYGVSKWAVDKITEELAFKLADTPVRINALDPGWLSTDMGGENADHPVEKVLPGALAPTFIKNDGPNGMFYSAIDLKWSKISHKMEML